MKRTPIEKKVTATKKKKNVISANEEFPGRKKNGAVARLIPFFFSGSQDVSIKYTRKKIRAPPTKTRKEKEKGRPVVSQKELK